MATILTICIHGVSGFCERDRLSELIELLKPVYCVGSRKQSVYILIPSLNARRNARR